MKDTTTRIRVTLDRFIGEPRDRPGATAVAHLISVSGSDVDVAAVWAATLNQEPFTIFRPGIEPREVTLGPNARSFRGSISIPGRKRSVRHLVAISLQAADETDSGRMVVWNGSPEFTLYFLSHRLGLPAHPTWSAWFWNKLDCNGRIESLDGLVCRPVAVRGTKQEFLEWIGAGLHEHEIQIPNEPGPLRWAGVGTAGVKGS